MNIWEAKLIYKARLHLGEGAYWHTDWEKFIFIDITGKRVGTINPVNNEVEIKQLQTVIGTIARNYDDKLIVGLQGSLEKFDFENNKLQKLMEIEPEKTANRCNDGACDGMGRLWFGTMHTEALLNEGALYCFDGILKKVIGGVSASNGICWSTDYKVMYYIDSFDRNVVAYDFNLVTGQIANKRVVVEINKSPEQLPDGMCIDAEGMLWVAIWGGSCVQRYNPANGKLIGIVELPCPNVTSCAFGGKNMSSLMITTAMDGLTKAQLEKHPDSGSLFLADTKIRGLAPVKFAYC